MTKSLLLLTWATFAVLSSNPFGYGVLISTDDGLICIGGNNDLGHHKFVTRIRLVDFQLQMDTMSPLPIPLANSSGSSSGNVVYVAGGNAGAHISGDCAACKMGRLVDLNQW